MGYYVTNIIAIRTGGVMSGSTDVKDMNSRISKIIKLMKNGDYPPDISDIDYCISKELRGHKGSYVVIAGVFNYWTFESSSVFTKKLSKEFGTEVVHICWDEMKDEVQCNIFLDGKPLFEVNENPLGQILRRLN